MKIRLRWLVWGAHFLLQVLPLVYLAFEAAHVVFLQLQDGPAYARGRLAISESQARWDLAQFSGALLVALAVGKGWRWAVCAYFVLTALVLWWVGSLVASRFAWDAPTLFLFGVALSCVATSALLAGRLRSGFLASRGRTAR